MPDLARRLSIAMLRRRTEANDVHEHLRISEERHRLLAEQANDVIWTMSLDGRITYISPSVERLRGFTREEAMEQSLEETLTPVSHARSIAYLQRLLIALERDERPDDFHGELQYRCRDGSTVWTSAHVIPYADASGAVVELLGVSRDISSRKAVEDGLRTARAEAEQSRRSLEIVNAELSLLANTDPLTGTDNRRSGERALADAVRSRAEEDSAHISLLILDIDHFKSFNDRHGHLAGDRVLIELVIDLRARMRGTDTLARWGGEEFIVILHDCPLQQALQIAETFRAAAATAAAARPPIHDELSTISIGVAEAAPGESVTDWVHRADQALYAAKSAGRNRAHPAPTPEQPVRT